MQLLPVFLLLFFTYSCRQRQQEITTQQVARQKNIAAIIPAADTSYEDAKKRIAHERNALAILYLRANQPDEIQTAEQITNCWVSGIGNDLYKYWAGTPWDFNGTTLIPKQGTIACGYFVTTLLQDMGLPINRIKLSTCAASEMMERLGPHQKVKKLNNLTYSRFCDSLMSLGKGVYVIGLDYHVGFIVNDGVSCWFIHSNYINKQGVVKELVQLSAALQASNTRWLISLTGDKDFIARWLTSVT